MKFNKITEIIVEQQETWRDKFFITLDIDWANDEVIRDTINLLNEYEVAATIYLTHFSPAVEEIIKNPKFCIGLHPNFNSLLPTPFVKELRLNSKPLEIIKNLQSFAPNAKTIRIHC